MTIIADQRIAESHLNRSAIIYIRQSSAQQVKRNTESQKFQLALRERAISYGWRNPIVIDDDLGVSANVYANRQGFQNMLTQITMEQVGIIFCAEASRLSRNSKDWAQLFELCAFFDTLVADIDQIYNLRLANDRMVLGIKGTMSEMELSILKTRLREGSIQKARRGELRFILVPGYSYDHDNKIVFDPDKRIQSAIKLMFSQFRKHTSIRQLVQWYQTEKVCFPVRRIGNGNKIVWEIPMYDTISKLLKNPFYAGVYGYGKRKIIHEYKDGALIKKRGKILPYDQWQVFIKNNHECYVSWEEFLEIQKKISNNNPQWDKNESLGAIREGLALFSGLLRCGHCGNKMYVIYRSKQKVSARYFCGNKSGVGPKCLSFTSKEVDKKLCEEILKALKAYSIEAGKEALKLFGSENKVKIKIAEQEVENAQYQAERAFEQYDQADPKNRHVASTLEERLNSRLVDLNKAKEKLSNVKESIRILTDEEKDMIILLSKNFESVWNHEKSDPVLKKRLIRLFINEVIVAYDDTLKVLKLVIHWNGGSHTEVSVKHYKKKRNNKTDLSLIEMVKKLSRRIDDSEIARVLNMNDQKTPQGMDWTKDKVINFRRVHRIRLQIVKKENVLTLQQAKQYLEISNNGINSLVKAGLIKSNQVMPYAPWEVLKSELDSETVQNAVKNLKRSGVLFPQKKSKKQLSLPFDMKPNGEKHD